MTSRSTSMPEAPPERDEARLAELTHPDDVLREAGAETRRWMRRVNTLLRRLDDGQTVPTQWHDRLQALRHKRDSVLTKLLALRHHRASGWGRACREWVEAQRELKASWRSLVNAATGEPPA